MSSPVKLIQAMEPQGSGGLRIYADKLDCLAVERVHSDQSVRLSFLQLHVIIQKQALVYGLRLVAAVGRSVDWRERLG